MAEHNSLSFPQGFLWGTATSSHQVEGSNTNNDWWAWEQTPGHIKDGSQSGLASDWWRAAERDLATAAVLGQNTHRMSLEWSRLEPQEGAWNEGAVARYREMLVFMRARGITPMITLHHFTLPLWLAERGGWESAPMVAWFRRYTERVVESFGDLCTLWCTINEPMIYAAFGYVFGTWPPGTGGLGPAVKALEQMAHAHAAAYDVIHSQQSAALVGYAKHLRIFEPADPKRLGDRLATRLMDYAFNESALVAFAEDRLPFPLGWSSSRDGTGPHLDFIGLNYYSRDMVQLDLRAPKDFYVRRFAKPGAPFSMEGWGEIYPEGLYRALKRLGESGLPIYVTEFGLPDNDDTQRPRFLITHLAAIHRALAEGVKVCGAYFWSLVDNFEWDSGWDARFGLIHIDPATQARTLTRSAEVYRRIATANGLERSLVGEIAPDLLPTLFPSTSTGFRSPKPASE